MKNNKQTIPLRKIFVYVASAVGIAEMLISKEGLLTMIFAIFCFIALVIEVISN